MIKSLANSSITNQKKYRSMMAGSVENNADHFIAEAIVTTSVASVTFDVSNLAALGYKHLQFRCIAQNSAASSDQVDMRFNSDSSSNYSYHGMYGNGSSAGSEASVPRTAAASICGMRSSADSYSFEASIVDLVDVFSSTKNKTIRAFRGGTGASGSTVQIISNSWYSQSPVTSITLLGRANNIGVGSRFSLYASKG